MTDTRDEAVANLIAHLRTPLWHQASRTELAYSNTGTMNQAANEIEQLYAERAKLDQALSAISRQLVEAQRESDIYKDTVASERHDREIVERRLAEAQGVIERMRGTPDIVEAGAEGMYGKGWNDPNPQKRPGDKMKDVWRKLVRDAITAAHAAAMRAEEKP